MDRAGLFLLGQAERLANARWDVVADASWWANLVIGRSASTMSTIWKRPCLDFLIGFLPGDHHHRHAAELGVGGSGEEIRGAGPQGREAHAGLPGKAAIGRRHETRRLFVAGQDQLDLLRPRQAVEKVQVLFAGNAEDVFDPFVLKCCNEKVGSFGHDCGVPGECGLAGYRSLLRRAGVSHA